MDWQDKLIHLYVYICQQYDQKHPVCGFIHNA